MALSYNLGYQESISVHPTRRHNFAGKVYSIFPNIWEWVIANNILSPYFQSTHQDHVDIRSQIQLHSRQDHGGTTRIINLISKGVALKVRWHHIRKHVTNRSFSKWFVRDPQVRSKKSPGSWNISAHKPGEDLEPSAHHWDSDCLLDAMITRESKLIVTKMSTWCCRGRGTRNRRPSQRWGSRPLDWPRSPPGRAKKLKTQDEDSFWNSWWSPAGRLKDCKQKT